MKPSPPTGALRLLLILAVTGCGGSSTEVQEPVPTTLSLSDAAIALTFLGETRRLSATVRDQSGNTIQAPITWSSDDQSVVTVTSTGIVRAESNGLARVSASAGGISASAEISVEQRASFLAVVSGDDQSGIAGTELPEPLVVRAQDRGGSPVEGVEVTFAPDANSGSVSPASVTTGVDGTVSTRWTLGVEFGPQRVVATGSDVSEAELNAFAGSETPTPDLRLLDPVSVERPDPTTFDTVTVRSVVQNQGDADAPGVRVQLLVDGVEVASTELLSVAAMSDAEVEFVDIGPLGAGTRVVEIVVDPDDAIVELNETNNSAARNLPVLVQERVEPGVTISGLSGEPGDVLLFRLDIAAGPTNLTVGLSGGSGDVDLWIEGGTRPSDRTRYDDCVSDGPTMEETCQIVDADGTYHIIVFAPPNETGPSGFEGSSLTVSLGGPVVPFDLELVFIDEGTESQNQAFRDAAARWSAIITGDVPDYDLGGQSIPSGQCIDGQPSLSGVIDDIIIYAAIRDIDGPGETLARAGPCFIRNGSSLPFMARMEFDSADVRRLEDDDDLAEVVLHEMGHALGIGSIWKRRDLLRSASTSSESGSCTVDDPDADTHFIGSLARQAFDFVGGVDYVGSKVPVANGEFDADCGNADGHWRESAMRTELMTPFLNSATLNPLSVVTIESLADLGYAVDLNGADAYVLPAAAQQVAGAGLEELVDSGSLVDLGDDVYRGPIWVMEQGGRVVDVIR